MTHAHTFSLAVVLAGAAFAAACGGAAPEPQNPTGPAASASAAPPSTSAPAASGAPSTAPAATPPGPAGQPAFAGPMKPVVASAMLADLQGIGLDAKNLPALDKLEPDKLRKVMRTFTKALGAKCADCHQEADFAAPTPMKAIASHMWDEFSRKLAMSDGAPLYCDSCHQGRMKFIDRHDKKALSTWMGQNFVDKEKRKDGKDHGCETCHGDPFDNEIFEKWTGKH